MLGFLGLLIVLGLVAFAVIALAKLIYHIAVVILKVVTALVVAGGLVWTAFMVLRFFAENPQYFG